MKRLTHLRMSRTYEQALAQLVEQELCDHPLAMAWARVILFATLAVLVAALLVALAVR